MHIKHFFDSDTSTFTYVVTDDSTKKCAIIDSVLNYDMYAGKTSTISADEVISYIEAMDLTVEWILETHVHADHLSASSYLKSKLGGKIAIGEDIKKVLNFWVPLFNTEHDTPLDARKFDHLFQDNERFLIGGIEVQVIHTPGHTPACVSYLMGDAVFVGDTIFMPYVGTARTDFPGGSAKAMYRSIQKLLSLPNDTRIFTCHDYPLENMQPGFMSTVAEQKRDNIMVRDGVSEDQYIAARNKKDEGKAVPKMLLPSIQVNLRAGEFGDAEKNNIHYIKTPLNQI